MTVVFDNDTHVCISTITPRKLKIESFEFQELCSLFEMAIAGFGTGSERLSDCKRLKLINLRLNVFGEMYFNVVHRKKGSVKNKKPTIVEHKLCVIISRLFMLFRRIFHESCNDNILAMPHIEKRQHHMIDSVAKVFAIDRNHIDTYCYRHLITSLCNLVFPDNSSKITLSTRSNIALQSSHTGATHDRWYSSQLEDGIEFCYDKWFEALGDTSQISSLTRVLFEPVSHAIQLKGLRQLVGEKSLFKSMEQQQMVDHCCNSANHKFMTLPCGGGKTMAVVVPAICDIMVKKGPGMRILVVPYSFLMETLKHNLNQKLKYYRSHLRIATFTGSEITPTTLPQALCETVPPEVLILNLRAAANLMQHHSPVVENWAKEDRLRGIFFDEVQTIIAEFDFREEHCHLRLYYKLAVPITLLSGSFHPKLVPPLMRFLRLSEKEELDNRIFDSIDLVDGGDPMGNGFDLELKHCSDYVVKACELITDHIKKKPGSHIHVLCCSRNQCEDLDNALVDNDIDCQAVNSVNSAVEHARIAKDWLDKKSVF